MSISSLFKEASKLRGTGHMFGHDTLRVTIEHKMIPKVLSKEFVAVLTRGDTGWQISKGIGPAGRWDMQSDQYRKTLSHVIDVIDVRNVTHACPLFAIPGNRARTQMNT